MATQPSVLAWRIPWTEEPGGLQSMALQSRTRLSDFHLTFTGCHNWAINACVKQKALQPSLGTESLGRG